MQPTRSAHATTDAGSAQFLAGGGEMGGLMRVHDWSNSALGPPALWPQSLRTVVRLMLNTGHPMYIWWGPDRACLYNDAYRESIGPERHPGSLGRPAHEVWAEIWDDIHPQIEQVMSGRGATWHVNQLLPITRHGRREDVYWTYSYSPIDDDTAPGGIGGVLVLCTETTQQILAARRLTAERDRLAQSFDQAPTFMAVLRGPEHRFEIANAAYTRVVGDRPLIGKTVAEALPEAVAQGYVELLDGVFATGRPYAAHGARYAVQSTSGAPATERVVDFVYQPMRDAQGLVTGIFVEGVDVTERAQAHLTSRESEARFRAALTAGRMGSWETDHTTKTRLWSDEGMRLFGLSLPGGRGQVGGPNDEFAAAIHPDDRHVVPTFQALARQQDSFPAEYRVLRPDGTTMWLSGRGLVVERAPNGEPLRLINIMADATERKIAEEQLQIERERLRLALGAGRMGAYDMNIKDDVLWWSPETYALFGLAPAGFVPSVATVTALIHPDDREPFMRLRSDAIAQNRPFAHEFRINRHDGTQLWVDHRGQAEYGADGVAVRHFGVIMDITERKAADGLLQDAARQKDTFIAVLAHELRNPLAPIRNAVHMLRRQEPVEAGARWAHDVIDRQVGHMAHLLDDLLDVSRLNRGQLHLRPKRLSLSTAIAQALELAQPMIDAAAHTFTVTLPDTPLALDGDMTRLAQIFSNILINAAKYTPPGGSIALTAEQQGGDAVVTVADTGIGIDAQHMPRIFEMFGQVESALNHSDRGQGIGLSLTKGLVELHGGTIAARSAGAGRGSEFEVRLPLAVAVATSPDQRDGAEAASAEPDTMRLRVLIADDLHDAADSLATLLEFMGHDVRVAYDGEQALHLAETFRPDVALLDLGMPKADGYTVCRRIRASTWGTGMTLIAQTGWGQDDDRRQTTEAGFDHHVVKPIDPDAVVALFRR